MTGGPGSAALQHTCTVAPVNCEHHTPVTSLLDTTQHRYIFTRFGYGPQPGVSWLADVVRLSSCTNVFLVACRPDALSASRLAGACTSGAIYCAYSRAASAEHRSGPLKSAEQGATVSNAGLVASRNCLRYGLSYHLCIFIVCNLLQLSTGMNIRQGLLRMI